MRKIFITSTLIFLSSSNAFAKSVTLFEITHEAKSKITTYRVEVVNEKPNAKPLPHYTLSKNTGKANLQTQILDRLDANALTASASRIAWENQYRKPASAFKKCTIYARVTFAKEQTKICAEDIEKAGKTQALLNRLSRYF